ncbi:MAG: ion transporter [Planctomycetes bacterium]|nr:ion transporter [Planctomycetota bacterium]
MANKLKLLAESKRFNLFIVGLIVLTSVLIGLDTYPSIAESWGWLINLIDNIILGCFVVEIMIRMGAEGRRPLRYFADPWNVFDFVIVGICLLPIHEQSVAVLRLVRVLRVLRLLKAMPQLRMIIQGMIRSLSSIGYIAILLFIHFYVFAVMGVSFFGRADEVHFGSLQSAMLTLFQVITLENWPDVMQPAREHFPVGGPAFFVVFIVLGTMVIMNLFVGVIVGGMTEAHQEIKKEYESARKAKLQKQDAAPSPAEKIHVIEKTIDDLKDRLRELRESIKS